MSNLILESDRTQELDISKNSILSCIKSTERINDAAFLVNRVTIGKGKRLFGEGTQPAGLKLIDSKTSTTGVIIATYEPAGELKTGSFALDNPNEAETERRKRLADEGKE